MNMSELTEKCSDGGFDQEAFGKMLDEAVEMFLLDPTLPEYNKVEIRITKMVKQLRDNAFHFCEYAHPEMNEERAKQLYPMRKEVLEYLTLVNSGLEIFLQAHPIPEKK